MLEMVALFALLGLIAAAAVAGVVVLCLTAHDVRLTLRKVNRLIAAQEQTFCEARQVCRQAQEIMAHTTKAAKHVEGLVGKACAAASNAIERVVEWPERMGTMWSEHVGGNGTRSRGSRPRGRSV